MEIKIYHDKTLPDFPYKRMFPHQQLKKLSFPIELDTVVFKDADIRYLERGNALSKPGQIVFTDINATLYGITNRKERNQSRANH